MFVFNNIELLQQLGKFKITDVLIEHSVLAISGERLTAYSSNVKKGIENIPLEIVFVDDKFSEFVERRDKRLTITDYCSLYVTLCNYENTLVVSDEETILSEIAIKNNVPFLEVDKLILRTIKDERTIKLYNLLKAVA